MGIGLGEEGIQAAGAAELQFVAVVDEGKLRSGRAEGALAHRAGAEGIPAYPALAGAQRSSLPPSPNDAKTSEPAMTKSELFPARRTTPKKHTGKNLLIRSDTTVPGHTLGMT